MAILKGLAFDLKKRKKKLPLTIIQGFADLTYISVPCWYNIIIQYNRNLALRLPLSLACLCFCYVHLSTPSLPPSLHWFISHSSLLVSASSARPMGYLSCSCCSSGQTAPSHKVFLESNPQRLFTGFYFHISSAVINITSLIVCPDWNTLNKRSVYTIMQWCNLQKKSK